MFEIFSTILKYFFAVIIYAFIYSIIRLIYLDIRSMSVKMNSTSSDYPYLKLLNRREELPYKVDEIYFLEGIKTLGRSKDNDYTIKDPFLSGEHVEFSNIDDNIYISDKGSTNGTFVNSKRIGIEKVLLNNGDKVTVGNLSFILVVPPNSNSDASNNNTDNSENSPPDGSDV